MASNTYKIPQRSAGKGGFFSTLDRFLRIDESVAQVIHVRFLPQILFISALGLIYIGSRHYTEKKLRAIATMENQVEDLRADYITLKEDYMFASKESEVARKAKALGLVESKEPPKKIMVTE